MRTRFSMESANEAFKTDKKLVGTISGKLGTKPFSGEFKQK